MRCRMYDFVYTTDLGVNLLVYRQDRHRIRGSELRPTPAKLVVYARRYNHRRSLCQLGIYSKTHSKANKPTELFMHILIYLSIIRSCIFFVPTGVKKVAQLNRERKLLFCEKIMKKNTFKCKHFLIIFIKNTKQEKTQHFLSANYSYNPEVLNFYQKLNLRSVI